jgi:hypothetical protein
VRLVASLPAAFLEDGLPAVDVAGPFVQRQNAGELAQIAHLQQLLLGQIVDHLPGHQAPHPARGEVQARLAWLRSAAQLDGADRGCYE